MFRLIKPRCTETGQMALNKFGYILDQTLGSGAYAKVKSAMSVSLNTLVAIKIIDKFKAPPDILNKFLPREIETLRAMKHSDRIVQLIDLIVTPNEVYIVMEMAENGDLLDFINKSKILSEPIARILFSDLVEGMSACHEKGIVHRDLKCENLLLDKDNRLKIGDFGFARVANKRFMSTFCGSLAYAAPEIISGKIYSGQEVDIWSMGIVLYAMVCGKLPFRDNSPRMLMHQIYDGVTFPGNAELSEQCKDLIKSILRPSAGDRATMLEIKEHPWMMVGMREVSSKETSKESSPATSTESSHETSAKTSKEIISKESSQTNSS